MILSGRTVCLKRDRRHLCKASYLGGNDVKDTMIFCLRISDLFREGSVCELSNLSLIICCCLLRKVFLLSLKIFKTRRILKYSIFSRKIFAFEKIVMLQSPVSLCSEELRMSSAFYFSKSLKIFQYFMAQFSDEYSFLKVLHICSNFSFESGFIIFAMIRLANSFSSFEFST